VVQRRDDALRTRLDDIVEVVTGCGALRGASLDMIQQARRGDELSRIINWKPRSTTGSGGGLPSIAANTMVTALRPIS